MGRERWELLDLLGLRDQWALADKIISAWHKHAETMNLEDFFRRSGIVFVVLDKRSAGPPWAGIGPIVGEARYWDEHPALGDDCEKRYKDLDDEARHILNKYTYYIFLSVGQPYRWVESLAHETGHLYIESFGHGYGWRQEEDFVETLGQKLALVPSFRNSARELLRKLRRDGVVRLYSS